MKSDRTTRSILFVDDEPSVLESLRRVVETHYPATFVKSAKEAIEAFEQQGPFAMVISDFRMPNLNGAELLLEIRNRDPDVVTMLFTGAAGFDDVSEAVRMGQIYRLIGKPCGAKEMLQNLEDGFRQYDAIRAEKNLLEQTLNGAVSALTTILSATEPLFFGRAQRVKKLAFKLADHMGIHDQWRLELASTFAYLGYLNLPPAMQERVYHKRIVPDKVTHLIEGFPRFAADLVKKIPRLEKIGNIIISIPRDYDTNWQEEEHVRRLASVIRLANDFDEYSEAHYGPKAIHQKLKDRQHQYLPGAMEALGNVIDLEIDSLPEIEIPLRQIQIGMTLRQDIRLTDGLLLASKGTVIDEVVVELMDNYRRTYDETYLPAFVRVIEDPPEKGEGSD
ncbi:MAG: response regulator [Verrucomicrobiota bacterium]|nr:response regulator [Verrucomicrobiota bacterium]